MVTRDFFILFKDFRKNYLVSDQLLASPLCPNAVLNAARKSANSSCKLRRLQLVNLQ
jgi:hypothetical protein